MTQKVRHLAPFSQQQAERFLKSRGIRVTIFEICGTWWQMHLPVGAAIIVASIHTFAHTFARERGYARCRNEHSKPGTPAAVAHRA
jgi:hypothetical protein